MDGRLSYRTERDGQERASWVQLVPTVDGGVWVLRLTVPGDRDEGTTALFDVLVGGFSVAGA